MNLNDWFVWKQTLVVQKVCSRREDLRGAVAQSCSKSFVVSVQRGKAGSSIQLFPGARQWAAGGAGGAADHLHPPGDQRRYCQTSEIQPRGCFPACKVRLKWVLESIWVLYCGLFPTQTGKNQSQDRGRHITLGSDLVGDSMVEDVI